jgi:hypothetical protein
VAINEGQGWEVRESPSESLAKVELDQQITTARAYPRSLTDFVKSCVEMATLTEDIARECVYAVPREEDGRTKMIEGPSARLGEIVLSAWGNCAAGARVADEDREFVYAQGFFFDLERNVRITREVRRRITNSKGRRYSTDMIAVTANAACSIAQRNAVFAGIPKAFWSEAYTRARTVIAGTGETLERRRDELVDTITKMGVPKERIYAALGVEGIRDIGVDQVVLMQGAIVSIRENEIAIDEAFPDPTAKKPESAGIGVAGLKEKLGTVAVQKGASVGTSEAVRPVPAPAAPLAMTMDPQPQCSICANESTGLAIVGRYYCVDHLPSTLAKAGA